LPQLREIIVMGELGSYTVREAGEKLIVGDGGAVGRTVVDRISGISGHI
jgi:hypothetical protein